MKRRSKPSSWDLDQGTHVFNGMVGLHHRNPGTVGAILSDDRIYAQVIADGIHLHPAVLKLLMRAKGRSRTILITDAIRAAGMQDGKYESGGQVITVQDGVVRTVSGGLAGSTLTMDCALRNSIVFGDLPFEQALQMTNLYTRRSIRPEKSRESLLRALTRTLSCLTQNCG